MSENLCLVCGRAHRARSCPSSHEMHRLLRALQSWVTVALPNAGWTFLHELCVDVLILFTSWWDGFAQLSLDSLGWGTSTLRTPAQQQGCCFCAQPVGSVGRVAGEVLAMHYNTSNTSLLLCYAPQVTGLVLFLSPKGSPGS